MTAKLDYNIKKFPSHIAIVMDGNGRWAEKKKQPRIFGHRQGSKIAKKIVTYANKLKIKHLTLYTFSKENWNRPKQEVNALMSLLMEALNKGMKDLLEHNIQLNFIGDINQLEPNIKHSIVEIQSKTQNCTGMTVHLALNYSSRWEIVQTVTKIIQKVNNRNLIVQDIDCDCFAKHLYSAVPYPDILIRTGGEFRVSNFLLWQIAYTELFFTETLWPNFNEKEFLNIIIEYQKRERRFGLIASQIKKN